MNKDTLTCGWCGNTFTFTDSDIVESEIDYEVLCPECGAHMIIGSKLFVI